ncbi:DNA repair protein Rad16 [Malassezia pachydermatis]|uniref:Dna repair protein n=1 Tax=Malassezia pachydermatis TaxID=77020 RepID=A0A0N0RSJ4_9BASI|nr:dna repair protein [Malassezia pachydermatis]KOS15545.1 dna repair protein [Malassezia pachydermatis]
MPAKQRHDLYTSNGIISVTSQILVVDMLSKRIPTAKVTGLVVLHAERITPTSIESFILRLFRQENKVGFVKAFSDQPEHFAAGFHTLQMIMGQLHLRQVDIWPRFHQDIDRDLGHRRADVVELHQPLTPSMRMIQNGIIECLEATLHEIQRSKLALDMEDIQVDQAMHKSFDMIIRRQLDPVWHRLSPAIKQLVGDLSTLRSLLQALLSYDSVSFYVYLETILASNAPTEPGARSHPSPWLLSDASNTIFREARDRIWRQRSDRAGDIEFVLEAPPKWSLLMKVMHEIEQDIYRHDEAGTSSNYTILIMADSEKTVTQLRALLNASDTADEQPGESVLASCLHDYISWTSHIAELQQVLASSKSTEAEAEEPVSEALQRKMQRAGMPANKRRRVRGGMAVSASVHPIAGHDIQREWDQMALHMNELPSGTHAYDTDKVEDEEAVMAETDDYFGLVDMDHVVVIHRYQGEANDRLLQELRPHYVVMYDPNPQFVRQVELHRALYRVPDLRIYFLLYTDSVEEQLYLASLRREKDAFERLIRQKGRMAIPLTVDGTLAEEDADQRMLRQLSTRVAGGQLSSAAHTPSVVVDMREFRSSLPSLLHAAGLQVIPCTLQVGDYVISSEMCVERKSLTDLVQSLQSGRLYTQCEAMSMHYPHAILLIEFDQDRAFTLQTIGGRARAQVPARSLASRTEAGDLDVQAKLVLLTLAFPRLRLIWSSSPYASVEILADLKHNFDEPDPVRAAAIGLDASMGREGLVDTSVHTTPMDMLRAMPGVTTKNAMYIARVAPSLQALCQCSLAELQGAIGAEPGRKLYTFLHQDAVSLAQ